MSTYEQQQKQIGDAAAQFPATFGLRAFPGDTFRVSLAHSYMSGERVMLYTEIRRGERWESFCKGTPAELRQEVVRR